MSVQHRWNRRSFLKGAGITALSGLAGRGAPALRAAPSVLVAGETRYDFDTVYDRFGTNCIKWDRQAGIYGRDRIAVGMGIADMDFRVAPAITTALTERTKHENWGYIDTVQPFVEGVVTWNRRRYGVDIDPRTVEMATGVHPGLVAAIQTFSPRGSKVIVQTPTYDGFYTDIAFAGCRAEESPLRLVEGRYAMDFEDLERRIGSDTRTLILCNPQNPTGNCWSRDDLTTLGEICLKRGVVVLADEIHCDFVSRGHTHTPFSTLPNRSIVANSVTFNSASKSFGLSAMKHGWFFSENADYMARIRANHRADLTTLGLIATYAAYAGGEDWLTQVAQYIEANLEYVESAVRSDIPSVRFVKPQGTYLAWLDFGTVAEKIGARRMAEDANRGRAAGAPSITPEVALQQYLVERAKVHLNPGSAYGRGGEGRMRMNVATSRKLVELALTNLAEALRRV